MRTVLVTGASSGIGLATSVELAKRNWTVLATMRDLGKRGELERQLAAADVGGNVRIHPLDVADQSSIDQFFANLELSKQPLDAVVHNAGTAVGGAFEDLSDADIRRVMEVNFFGVLAVTRRLLPAFRAQRHGRIVIISSETAYAGQPAISPYCASKWALEGWAESLCYEVAPFDVQITLIEPGAFRTNIWTSSPRVVPNDSVYRPLLQHLETAVHEHVEATAGDPREVANAVAAALQSPRPRFRYPVGFTAKMGHLMRGKVPSSLVRKIVRRYFGFSRIPW
jgi:NAD(P)-dependent dehydrogenase (short-subunit alcohol dehydrogenase family)